MTAAAGDGLLRFATFLASDMLPVYRFLATGSASGWDVRWSWSWQLLDEFEPGEADLGVIYGLP
jgi:hypothetical protein